MAKFDWGRAAREQRAHHGPETMLARQERRAAANAERADPPWLKEMRLMLCDAEECRRLTDWEYQFVTDVAARIALYGASIALSEKQKAALKRIEAKVYEV